MIFPNLNAIATTITKLTSAPRTGRFFAEEAQRLRSIQGTFQDPAVRGAQFEFMLDAEGMDEPIQAYAVITKQEDGFDFVMTRDENYLAEHAE